MLWVPVLVPDAGMLVVSFRNGDDCARELLLLDDVCTHMPQIELDEETIKRLDGIRVEDESYDELVMELVNIYEASELTLFHAGD